MKHGEGVLAAGETEHDLVTFLDHVVLTDGFSWGGLEGVLSSRYHNSTHITTHHITSHHITTHHTTTQLTTHHITSQHNISHHNTTQHNTSHHNSSQLITSQHINSHHNTTYHITTHHTHHLPIDFIIRLGTSGNKSLCFFINFTLSLNSMPGTIAVYSNTPSTPV